MFIPPWLADIFQGEMEGVGTIAGTVKIHSPKFAPPTMGSGVVRLTWSGSQTLAAVRKLRVEGSHTRFLRSQTQRPFANFALSFWLRKVRLRQCAGPIVYRPLPFCPQFSTCRVLHIVCLDLLEGC